MTLKTKKYKVVFRPGKPLTKVALLAAIVLSTAALVAIHVATEKAQDRLNVGRANAFAQEQTQEDLNQRIDALGSAEGVVQIAKDEGWADPDEVIIDTE